MGARVSAVRIALVQARLLGATELAADTHRAAVAARKVETDASVLGMTSVQRTAAALASALDDKTRTR